MEAKSVLVSYVDQEKVLKFDISTKLTFITKEFMSEFRDRRGMAASFSGSCVPDQGVYTSEESADVP